MGYTHYWYREQEIDPEIYDQIVSDFKRIIPLFVESGVVLANGSRTGQPIVTSEKVLFNGRGEEGHEGFYFPRLIILNDWETPNEKGQYFDFCKTAEKPYDLAVTSFLLIAKHHLQDKLRLSSDGEHEDWKAAICLCEQVLQTSIQFFR